MLAAGGCWWLRAANLIASGKATSISLPPAIIGLLCSLFLCAGSITKALLLLCAVRLISYPDWRGEASQIRLRWEPGREEKYSTLI